MPRVAVLVDTSTEWGRDLIRGVTSYAQNHGPWQLQVEPRGRENVLQLPSQWNGDGVIARVSNPNIAADLRSRDVPVVNISGIELEGCSFPRVAIDYEATARLASEHFYVRGFQRFAYVGPLHYSYVNKHADAFQDQIGTDVAPLERFQYIHESMGSQKWQKQRLRIESWLHKLEKPIAVFAWGTSASCQLLDACWCMNIQVPDDVAVLAGAEDALIAQTTTPPMSAVLNPSKQMGYRAAERLANLMNGGDDSGEDERVAPIEVVTRRSTDVLAIKDQELSAAVRYIRENVFSELTVAEVARSVPMSVRSLQVKFRELFGRSPLAEIHRLRIARVKELLASTDLPIASIAQATGFGTAAYMATMFKRETKVTPLQYRLATRLR
ncbi:xylose operon regulatory protein [Rhodopirellula maiorica SM1]|uniref:Xylose operon regulatory protein n=2 Tax=Novipirellula TaxID=2795426 RepID=M5RLC3_9BACT|nr:xylose operon regulatory protein [Rhodopirellula maiorica SM1]